MLYHLLHGAVKPNYIDLTKCAVQTYLTFVIVQILYKNNNTILHIHHDCMIQFEVIRCYNVTSSVIVTLTSQFV